MWAGFWARVAEDDLEAARRYLHSSIRGIFPGMRAQAEWHEVALQMAFCRVDQEPLPISDREIAYAVHCEHGGEKAETLIILRRDGDGAWRFTSP